MLFRSGKVAEKIAFGDLYQSSGVMSDLSKATKGIMSYLRHAGLGETLSYIVSENSSEAWSMNLNISPSNEACEQILKSQANKSEELLLKNKKFFKEVSSNLIKNGQIIPEDFQKIAKHNGLNFEIVSTEKELCMDYKNKYEKFFEEII